MIWLWKYRQVCIRRDEKISYTGGQWNEHLQCLQKKGRRLGSVDTILACILTRFFVGRGDVVFALSSEWGSSMAAEWFVLKSGGKRASIGPGERDGIQTYLHSKTVRIIIPIRLKMILCSWVQGFHRLFSYINRNRYRCMNTKYRRAAVEQYQAKQAGNRGMV